jgi:hypothetical protein
MKRLFYKSLIAATMLVSFSSAEAAVDYREIVQATRSILAGRCFQNEDNTRMGFGSLQTLAYNHSEIDVEISFEDGQSARHRESIKIQGMQVIVEQLVNGNLFGKYLVSVEPPFQVLRLRPTDEASSNFISRECMYQESERKNVCYLKMKSDNDVFVSVFNEVPCL